MNTWEGTIQPFKRDFARQLHGGSCAPLAIVVGDTREPAALIGARAPEGADDDRATTEIILLASLLRPERVQVAVGHRHGGVARGRYGHAWIADLQPVADGLVTSERQMGWRQGHLRTQWFSLDSTVRTPPSLYRLGLLAFGSREEVNEEMLASVRQLLATGVRLEIAAPARRRGIDTESLLFTR